MTNDNSADNEHDAIEGDGTTDNLTDVVHLDVEEASSTDAPSDTADIESTDGDTDTSESSSDDQETLTADDDSTSLPPPPSASPVFATQPVAPTLSNDELPELRSWATQHSVLDDPYITELLHAVDNRSDLTLWASIDPLQNLPHPPLRRGGTLRRISKLMLFVRNVGVFVPVAITWFGIREATTAFGRYADVADKAGDGAQLNFLRFWQSGGNGELSSSWRIQHIALLDALLIALIVLLTLVAGVLEARANRQSSREEGELERSRTKVALSIRKALHGSRQATPESITQGLAESLADLLGGARLMNSAALRIERTSVGLESIGPRFDLLNERLDRATSQLAGDLLKAVESLRVSVVDLGRTVDGDLTQVLNQVMVGLDEIRDQLGKTSASVEFGTKKLRDDLDAVHSQLAGVMRGGRP